MPNSESFYRFFQKKGIYEAGELVASHPEYFMWFVEAIIRSRGDYPIPTKDRWRSDSPPNNNYPEGYHFLFSF